VGRLVGTNQKMSIKEQDWCSLVPASRYLDFSSNDNQRILNFPASE